MSDIFISYAREDRDHAERVAHALQAKGWSVWWDRIIPAGRAFADIIEQEIDAARCVVVLWSNYSTQSRWVRTEASAGLERDILVPVVVEPVQRIPLAFRELQTADLSQWNGAHTGAAFQQVLSGVSHVLARVTPVTPDDGNFEPARSHGKMSNTQLQPPAAPVAAQRLPYHRGSTAFSSSDELVVPSSPGKLVGVALGSAAFVVVGGAMLFHPEAGIAAIGGVNVVFFGLCGMYALWRLVRPVPAVVINGDGIFDNASAVGVGLIRWDEIDDLRECLFMNQTFLGIFPTDREALIGRQAVWKRWVLRANRYINAAPANIPQGILPMTVRELLREIAVRFGR